MTRPRAAVIDTNVVVAGLLTGDEESPTRTILDGMLEARFVFLLSEELIAEYRAVLLRKPIATRHGLEDSEVDDLLAEMVRNGIVRAPEGAATKAPDGGDQHLWDLVRAEAGAVLVTGDAELRESRRDEIATLGPREFVDRLQEAP